MNTEGHYTLSNLDLLARGAPSCTKKDLNLIAPLHGPGPLDQFHGSKDATIPISHAYRVKASIYNPKIGLILTIRQCGFIHLWYLCIWPLWTRT